MARDNYGTGGAKLLHAAKGGKPSSHACRSELPTMPVEVRVAALSARPLLPFDLRIATTPRHSQGSENSSFCAVRARPWAQGSGLIDSEDDDGGERDSGHECVGTSVVAGVDAAPVFDSAEPVFRFLATAIEGRVVRERWLGLSLHRVGYDNWIASRSIRTRCRCRDVTQDGRSPTGVRPRHRRRPLAAISCGRWSR